MDAQKVKTLADRVSPLRKSRKVAKSIGSPTDFKHLLHIGTDSHRVDISSVPNQWQDILDIAKYCNDLDLTSNSSNDSDSTQKKDSVNEKDTKPKPEEEFVFESEIDLFADLQTSMSDEYKKFLFG